jgi:hypothetical protein
MRRDSPDSTTRQIDTSLIREAEDLVGSDIHGVHRAIGNYQWYARMMAAPPTELLMSRETIEARFDKWERVLRLYVGHRKVGEMPSMHQVEEEEELMRRDSPEP